MCKSVKEPQSATNLPVGCTKLFEGAEAHYVKSCLFMLLVNLSCFQLWKATKRVRTLFQHSYRGGGLTLVITVHLEHPPKTHEVMRTAIIVASQLVSQQLQNAVRLTF